MKPFSNKAIFLSGIAIAALVLVSSLVVIFWRQPLPDPAAKNLGSAPSQAADQREPITPIPLSIALNPEKVRLGNRLFHDPRLSRGNTVACASCHILSQGGADGKARSIGVAAQQGVINSPTVFNSSLNFRQFWDGRAATLEDQIDGPLANPLEMGSTWPETIGKLKQDHAYKTAFDRIYPDGITPASVKDAIATFERSLITPNGRFDKFLRGEKNAITAEEKKGYSLFKSYGCIACHQGMNVGGNMYEKLGVMRNYFAERGNLTSADQGRFNITGNPEHKHEFKVPSLRNAALTAPYFHDGSAATLEDAVRIMGRYQLGIEIPAGDVKLIARFISTLSGEYNGRAL